MSTRETVEHMKLIRDAPRNVDHIKYSGSAITKDETTDRHVDICLHVRKYYNLVRR